MVKFLFGNRKLHLRGIVAFLCFLFLVKSAEAQRTASTSGSWTNTATWGGSSVPTATDAVTINAGITVTVDVVSAQCGSLTINANSTTTNGGIVVSGTNSLSVTSSITIVAPTASVSSIINAGDGTITTGTLVLNGSSTSTRLTVLSLSSGTINCNAINITGTAAQTRITFNGAGVINVGNGTTGTIGAGATLTSYTLSPGSTINYNGAAQTPGSYTYQNLILSGSGLKTLSGVSTVNGDFTFSGTATAATGANLTIGGNLDIGASNSFTVGAHTTSVVGTTSVSGTIFHTSTTGSKTYSGDVYVNSGGSWSNSVNEAISIGGSFQNNGTFTAGSGLHTFTGTGKTFGGSVGIAIPALSITGTYTNNSISGFTVSTSIAGTGTLSQGSGAILNIGGTATALTINAPIVTNTVNYNGTTQTVLTGTYNALNVSGAGTKTLENDVTVGGLMSITSTSVSIGANALTLNGGLSISSGTLVGGTTSDLVVGSSLTLPTSLSSLQSLRLNGGTTTLSGSLVLSTTGTLSLSGGVIVTSSTSVLTVSNTASGSVTGGSSTSYVDGPLNRRLALGTLSGSWLFPIGDASNYYPYTLINPVTSAALSFSVEAFSSNSSGSSGNCVTSISSTEYWKSVASSSLTSASVSLGRNSSLGSFNAVGRSLTSAANGAYDTYYGSVSGGTLVANSDNIGAVNSGTANASYFALVEKTVALPVVNSPTSQYISKVDAYLGATLASSCPTATEVGVYYATNSGSVVAMGTKVSKAISLDAGAFSVLVSGLTSNTTYYYVAYAKNANGTSYTSEGSFTTRNRANYYVNGTYSSTDDIYTTAAGTNTTTYGQSPNTPAATLAWLLNTSGYSFQSGDTIFIDAGTYGDQDLSSPPNGIVIIGAGARKTIFTNGGSDNFFMRINDNNTILSSMSITNYNDQGVSGVGQTLGVETNITGVKIKDVLIYYETAPNQIAGYPIQIASGASVEFSGGGAACTAGGGGSAGGGIGISSATVIISNYLFYANEQSLQHGGAVRIEGGNTTIRNSAFKYNKLSSDQRGTAMYVTSGTVNVYDSEISDNSTGLSADMTGGSIWITGGNFRITRSKIMNHTQTGSSFSKGAGIAVTGGTVTIDSCYFSGNSGKTSVATDVYVEGGVTLARYNTFASSSFQIGRGAGTFTIEYSGNPSSNGTITKTNTITTTYTPTPSIPTYTGSCSSSISSFTILPIELTQFNGDCSDGHVLITWQTATEKNNKLFTIERSLNGVDFNVIGSVAGSGNSLQLRNYKFVDADDVKGIVYYRLSQEDYDGKQSQSNIISVDKSCQSAAEPEIVLYPNPTQQNLIIDVKLLRSSQVAIEVMDAIGRTVKFVELKRYDEGIQSIDMNLDEVAKGIYFVNVLVNEQRFSQKFVKL